MSDESNKLLNANDAAIELANTGIYVRDVVCKLYEFGQLTDAKISKVLLYREYNIVKDIFRLM